MPIFVWWAISIAIVFLAAGSGVGIATCGISNGLVAYILVFLSLAVLIFVVRKVIKKNENNNEK